MRDARIGQQGLRRKRVLDAIEPLAQAVLDSTEGKQQRDDEDVIARVVRRLRGVAPVGGGLVAEQALNGKYCASVGVLLFQRISKDGHGAADGLM